MLAATRSKAPWRGVTGALIALAVLALSLVLLPQPAFAAVNGGGSFDNALIADKALSYWSGSNTSRAPGSKACQDAQKPGDSGGQCRAFANCIVWMVSNHTQNLGGTDYFAPFLNAGGKEITDRNELVKGDIIQVGQGTHTTIIVSKVSDGQYMVVDSNHWSDETVGYYQRPVTLDSTTRAFRMGQASQSAPPVTTSIAGAPSTVALNGVIHNFRYDATHHNLRHEWADASGWHFENLDGDAGSLNHSGNDVGQYVSAVVLNGQLQVFYYDATLGNLRHAWTDASGWRFETLDGDGASISRLNGDTGKGISAISLGGGLQLFYYEAAGHNLRHAWTDASGWHFENLDGDAGSIFASGHDEGQYVSAAAFGSSIQLFYYDKTSGNLRHAWTDATGWHRENLDGDLGSVGHSGHDTGQYVNVLNLNGAIQLFYYDVATNNLRHAWTDASGWRFETLDGDTGSIGGLNADAGKFVSVAAAGSQLQLMYYSTTGAGKYARHAWTDTSGWHFENLEGDGNSISHISFDAGQLASMAWVNGVLQAFYYDGSSGNLRHAWSDAGGWHFETLEGDRNSVSQYDADVR